MTAVSDEEAWSVKASGLFVWGKFDRFDRKVAKTGKNSRNDRFYWLLSHIFWLQGIESTAFFLNLRMAKSGKFVVKNDHRDHDTDVRNFRE